jgi:hypothetical protein
VPARPDRALAPGGSAIPQRLRPHRGHGDRDMDGRSPGPGRDDRGTPAHLLRRGPRPRGPRPGASPR